MDLRRVASTDVFRYRPDALPASLRSTTAAGFRACDSDLSPLIEQRTADVRDGFYIARAARLAQKARPPPFFTPLPVCADADLRGTRARQARSLGSAQEKTPREVSVPEGRCAVALLLACQGFRESYGDTLRSRFVLSQPIFS
jgi:hypothetical protein